LLGTKEKSKFEREGRLLNRFQGPADVKDREMHRALFRVSTSVGRWSLRYAGRVGKNGSCFRRLFDNAAAGFTVTQAFRTHFTNTSCLVHLAHSAPPNATIASVSATTPQFIEHSRDQPLHGPSTRNFFELQGSKMSERNTDYDLDVVLRRLEGRSPPPRLQIIEIKRKPANPPSSATVAEPIIMAAVSVLATGQIPVATTRLKLTQPVASSCRHVRVQGHAKPQHDGRPLAY
jgi:hypothetical protein